MAIQIELIPSTVFSGKEQDEKVRFILNMVRRDKILVLEATLSPVEEKLLIEKTMDHVTKDFPGIEIASFGEEAVDLKSKLVRFLGGRMSGFTVVGPSNLVKEVKRDPDKLSLWAAHK
ncbi:DUF2073 domain-containing protein [Candidatus Micrarchaeota archaeon]|nr:DUF2073 domain-containing protein [Candidatus Micrarchaeota archaeon]